MTTILIQLLHSRAGAFFQWLAGLVIGWLSAQVLAMGIEIPAESWQSLELALSGIGAFLVTFAVQWYQARQIQKIQTTAGTKPDAWPGSETLNAIDGLATLASSKVLQVTSPAKSNAKK